MMGDQEKHDIADTDEPIRPIIGSRLDRQALSLKHQTKPL